MLEEDRSTYPLPDRLLLSVKLCAYWLASKKLFQDYLEEYNEKIFPTSLIIIGLLISSHAAAWQLYDADQDGLYLWGATYTHFSDSDDYKGANILVGLEVEKPNHHLYGLALFNNSYSQFSQYLFYGKVFEFDDTYPGLHAKITAGIIHGYRGKFEDNLILNKELGVAPVIVPGVGYQRERWGADLFLLANQGVLLALGYKF